MSELRVPTTALPAEVLCADGRRFSGRIFVPALAQRHGGPMRPEEWMNEPTPFFPFLPDDAAAPIILNKHEVVVISVPAAVDEPQVAPDLPERKVIVECGYRQLTGTLRIDMPTNQSRVLDYMNRFEIFLTLRDGERHHLVQKHRITRVIEMKEDSPLVPR